MGALWCIFVMTGLSTVSGLDVSDMSGHVEELSGGFWTALDTTALASGQFIIASDRHSEGKIEFIFLRLTLGAHISFFFYSISGPNPLSPSILS